MRTIALAVVEPGGMLLEGLRRIFGRSAFRIAYSCETIEDLWKSVPAEDAELAAILVDSGTPVALTVDDMERLQRTYPNAKIVLMSDRDACRVAMRVGNTADGLVLKSSASAVLLKALELILLGERIFPSPVWLECEAEPGDRQQHDIPAPLASLSEREVQVMDLLCEGCPNKIIAQRLGISEATVKVHVKAILRKTQSKNRTEAALMLNSFRITGIGVPPARGTLLY